MRYLTGLVAAAVALTAVVFAVADRADAGHRVEATTDHLAFVVHHVDTSDVIADPEFPADNMSAGGRFLVVKLSVINTTADAQVFHSALATLSDGSVQYPVVVAARHYVGEEDVAVSPGQSVETALVFDVPRDVEPRSIVLREDRASSGVAVPL